MVRVSKTDSKTTTKEIKARKSAPPKDGVQKKRRYKRGTIAYRKNRMLVKETGTFIPKAAIRHLVRGMASDVLSPTGDGKGAGSSMRFQKQAFNDMHLALEAFCSELFAHALTFTEEKGLSTTMPRDVHSAYKTLSTV